MTQYYSRINTDFNGDVYSIPFSYINENEINVYINDELWEEWEFLNESQIKLLELPSDLPANSIITIQRNTNIEEKVVDFTNNTMLSESALDLSNDQFLYAIQEVYDDVSKFKIDVQEDVDKKVEAISEAASKINALEEAVVTATDAAQVASEQAEIAVETSTEAKELLDSSLEEIQQQGVQTITEIYKAGQAIVDTGIHTRATIDLDNITDKAKQDIQYQAKLANASFCANSGNTSGGQTRTSFEPWARPTATGTITTLPEGNMTITASANSSIAWKAFNNVYASSTSDGWRPMATGQQWWKVVFPYRIKITGLLYRNACSDESSSITGRFYTNDTMDTPIGDGFTSPSNNAGSVTITNIPEEGVITDTIYLQKTAGNKYAGLGELEVTAKKLVQTYEAGGEPEIIHAPGNTTITKTFTLPNFTSNNQDGYVITGNGTLSAGGYYYFFRDYNLTNEWRVNKHQGTIYGQVKFPEGKTAVINKIHTPKVSFNLGYGLPSTNNWTVIMYRNGQQVFSQNYTGLNTIHNIVPIEVDTIRITNITSNNPDWIGCSAFKFTGYEVIEVNEASTCYFKVGGNYPELVATNIEKTFKRDCLEPIKVVNDEDGIYNIFIPEYGNPYKLKNIIEYSKVSPRIYTSNITKVGSLTDTNSWISGFSAQNYFTYPEAFDPENNTWEHVIKIKMDTISDYNALIDNPTKQSGYRMYLAGGQLTVDLSSDGTENDIAHAVKGQHILESGINYWIKTIFDGAKYVVSYSTDGIVYVDTITVESTLPIKGNVIQKVGVDADLLYPLTGAVDLSQSYIKINGELWWKGVTPINTNTVWLNTYVQPYKAYKFDGTQWVNFNDVPIGSITVEGGVITSVETFDYNLTFKKATSDAPSDKYIPLTLGASGATYIAPADGYFYFSKIATAAGQYAVFDEASDGIKGQLGDGAAAVGYGVHLLRRVKKGVTVKLKYSLAGDTKFFRFIYAEREV